MIKRRLALGGILLLAMGMGLSSCGKPGPPPTPAPLPSAPDFTVTTVDSSAFTLAQNRGKVVVLMATASWCTSCIPEVQTLARLHREYGPKGVEVLILSVWPGETVQELLRFRDRVGGGRHLWAMDRAGLFAQAYRIRVLGTTLIIDREGGVAYRDEGATSYETYQDQLKRLL